MKKVGFLTHTKSYSTPTPTREIRAPIYQIQRNIEADLLVYMMDR